MGGVKRPIHPAALAAGYVQDRLGTGQIARVLPSCFLFVSRGLAVGKRVAASG
jgi:hypothetical protein